MRLSDFILTNLKAVLQEWQDFAATLVPAGQTMDKTDLLDHAKKMLEAIATDLDKPQTEREETKKSKGHVVSTLGEETAASSHGKERQTFGFSLDAMVAEYRALRASVTRLWQKSLLDQSVPVTMIGDLIRFNEAIDQAISESVASYSLEKDQQTRMFDTILSSSPDLNFTFTMNGKFSYVNKALAELLERPYSHIVGQSFSDLGLSNATDLQIQIQYATQSKQQIRGEMPYTSPSGKQSFYDYIFVPVLDEAGHVEAIAGTARNITERKAMEDLNWRRANYDQLTGLPNRRLFLDRLDRDIKHAVRSGGKIALLFIDLDRFKEANDTFGHHAGDLLLKLVTNRIRSCVRETDTVARLGGDEFTVIVQDLADSKHAQVVALNVLATLTEPFQILDNSVSISASIGIALWPKNAHTPDQLLKNADQAMYVAKNAGRNQFSFFLPDAD